MKIISLLVVLFSLAAAAGAPPQTDYATLKAEAEQLYAAGSYARAHEVYARAAAQLPAPPAGEARWISFRLADTLWRAGAATETADTTKFDQARQQLEDLIRDGERVPVRDQVWAEAHESLGDFYWTRRGQQNWGAAWPHYQAALDWWAGAREVALARTRYLKIVFAADRAAHPGEHFSYGEYHGNYLPLDVLENAVKIAANENEKARARYLLAMTLRRQGDWPQRQRVAAEFEAALRPGKQTDWYDDALFHYAAWMEETGRISVLEDGNWRQEPDYAKAVELYRRLASEFAKGETRYYDLAQTKVSELTRPHLSVAVSNFFLPGSEMQFQLHWRNVKKINFALYPIKLIGDVQFANQKADDVGGGDWLRLIDLRGRAAARTWSKETADDGRHRPGQETVRIESRIESPLATGAYVLEATTADATATRARELVLVTDASLVLKATPKQTLLYFCDVLTGAPISNAAIRFAERAYRQQEQRWAWREEVRQTNEDGIAVFSHPDATVSRELFVAAEKGARQAFAGGSTYHSQSEAMPWRVYAVTDRPAYRPGETAQWKFLARRYADGAYNTPANQVLEFEINDPRGTKVKEGKASLNSFGSAWGNLELTATMPLGEYRVNFWDENRRRQIGGAVLFRLEEYKLPEFKVSVQTPEDGGRKKAFRLGERVEVKIQAGYYFGGPVASGTVEVVVYQNPFYHWWHEPREFEWYYDDIAATQRRNHYGGSGQIVKRETLKLDQTGGATLAFDTPRGTGQDFEYRIEARVTDLSRREIVTSDLVRVTRQRYYVYPRAAHQLYRPGDKVSVNLKALDANNQPVLAEGRVTVTRDYWSEIWLDPQGREVKGEELRLLRERSKVFPPVLTATNARGWRVKFRGYQHEEVLTQTLKTNTQGAAELSFTPAREGFYRVAWVSPDQGAPPVRGETTVWVATNATNEIGYRHGGLELIVDRETFRAGERAPVLLNAPSSGRFVLFSVEGADLYSYQLIRLTGTTKLVEVAIDERHVPNIYLSAAMVSDREIFQDTKQIIVPPVKQFLHVEVKADREQYQPREEGTLWISAKDDANRPVAAEVALGLVDESVFYIQQDYASDPRRFFYGDKRNRQVWTYSTFQQKSFAKLVEGADQNLYDERDGARLRRERGAKDDDEIVIDSRSEYAAATRGVSDRIDMLRKSEIADLPINGREFQQLQMMAAAPTPPPSAAPEAVSVSAEPAVQVRSDFRSTIFWQPDVLTGADGTATVKVKYPDSLTGWRALARVATAGNQFGTAATATRTKQPLIARLQAPRFFVAGDQATVSAVINNNTDAIMRVATSLDAEGVTISGLLKDNGAVKGEAGPIDVPANGEVRVDWLVNVERAGTAKLKVTARGASHADAMEREYVVHEHGLAKLVAKSGKLRGVEALVKIDLPRERRAETTSLSVQIAPSMAVTMLDALPYLIDYPYGCTEQTMSRFLPAAITAKTLRDLGQRPEDVMNKIFGGVEAEHAAATHPDGKKDLRQLNRMTDEGLARLYDFQHADGGWGWWKEGESDHFMTAYVVWGLTLAREAGINIREDVVQRGVAYLDKELVEEEKNLDYQAWMLHALAADHAAKKPGDVSKFQRQAFDNLWARRDQLNAYTRALLALGAHYFGDAERARVLIQNLENGVKIDDAPDASIVMRGGGGGGAQTSPASTIATAHWGEDGFYWRWSEGGIEATAFALRALVAIEPQHKLIEPVTNWLVKNRRGAQWSNTRDTAITILALNDYLRASGELQPDLEYELLINNQLVTSRRLTAADALAAPSKFAISNTLIHDGMNEIVIRRKGGRSPLYFSAQAEFFSLEEPVTPAGNEIFVRRQYYKLVGRPTLLKGYVYDRVPFNDGDTVRSGERVEAVLTVEAKNNYEYLLFEDLKPAGLEAVQIRSGEGLFAKELKSGAIARKLGDGNINDGNTNNADEPYTTRTRWVYQELRDRKVALFIDKLPQGVWEIRYDLRAETPGRFHALPLTGHAMYIPEIRANGGETRITIEDR